MNTCLYQILNNVFAFIQLGVFQTHVSNMVRMLLINISILDFNHTIFLE
jgi:hypothetical protein